MKYSILRSEEIKQEKWDNFIKQSLEGNIYATYTYLQYCERAWRAAVLFDEEGNYGAVMPFQIRKVYGIEYIYQDPFARELGIFSTEKFSKEDSVNLAATTFEKYRYIANYHFNVDNYKLLHACNFHLSHKLSQTTTFHLDLNRPYGELYSHYNQNRKRNLKKAKKLGLEILSSSKPDEALLLFKDFTFSRIEGLLAYQLDLMKDLYDILHKLGELKIYYVFYQNKITSAAFYNCFNKKITFLFGANSKLGFRIGSSTFLHDHVIRENAETECILDFEGGSIPSLGKFYSSFGAERKVIYTYQQNNFPLPVRWLMESRKKYLKS
ncbi:hypothetical protein WJR50_24560 [Catalinimonas sp. 4WD22]|uniref:hypothetical protein n=1 Tax=Catalinimonas locisalis TaxID=3133978 RepID=UPI003101A8AD